MHGIPHSTSHMSPMMHMMVVHGISGVADVVLVGIGRVRISGAGQGEVNQNTD